MSLVFFTDRDLGKQFPNILSEAGLSVEKHFDHFQDATKDEEWLAEIGRRGWYAITHDQRIRYKPNEKAAVCEAGVGLFIVIGKVPFPQLAGNFIATLPKIKRFVEQHPVPLLQKSIGLMKKQGCCNKISQVGLRFGNLIARKTEQNSHVGCIPCILVRKRTLRTGRCVSCQSRSYD